MKKVLFLIILFTLLFQRALAVNVLHLYQAEVTVPTQSSEDRVEATKHALEAVLIKVSGNPLVAKNPVVKAGIQRAEYYVQDFTYSQPSPAAAQYSLRVRFEKFDVDKLLKKAEVPYWGESRPLVLVWLVVETANQAPEIIGNESPVSTLDLMKRQAKRFGLPLLFPLLDVADVNQISVNNIEDMALPLLKVASKRYSPDALLIGDIQQKSNTNLQSRWLLVLNNNQWDWIITGNSMEEVVSSVVNQASQMLAKHYARVTDSQIWLNLEVAHLTKQADIDELMQYLKQLSPVQQVKLSQVSNDCVKFAVLVRGPLINFQQQANEGEHLILKSKDMSQNKLVYEWAQ